MVLRGLDGDYSSFIEQRVNGDKNAHPPGFKGKPYFTTMIYNQSGFKIKDQTISLSHLYNEVPLVFELLRTYSRVYQVTVFQKDEKYYLGIVHEAPEKLYVDNGLYQAIDSGITKTITAINTESKFFEERKTSKRCYVCGKEHDMPLWKRTMKCDCGNVIDRDRNSSIYIMLRFLSQNAMWTGYQQFVGNLRQTGLMVPKLALQAYS